MRSGLNVLIGGNGAGKSNFIAFFQMLGAMMDANRGLQAYVAEAGRADALLFRGVEETKVLQAVLSFDRNRYEFDLKVAADGSLFFSKENVFFDGPRYGPKNYIQGNGHLESNLSKKHANQLQPAEAWAVKSMRNWRVYHFHNTSRTAPFMRPVNAVDNGHLHADAGNIAAFLLRMREENPEHYERVILFIRQAAPYFGEFVLKPDTNGQVQLLWKERYSDKVYYPFQLSDGSLRFICLATLLLQPEPPGTIIIDEPELGLHPVAISALAGMLRLAEETCQLIVSTQSSPLVDYLNLEDLIIVDRVGGETQLKRPDPEELAVWMEDYSIGEMWDKNLLGGRPRK